MDIFNDLVEKKYLFTYKDEDGRLFIIGENFYFDGVTDDILKNLYDKYEKNELSEEDEKDIFIKVLSRSRICVENLTLEEKMERRKRIKNYISKLTNEQVQPYKEQMKKFEILYKKYVSVVN